MDAATDVGKRDHALYFGNQRMFRTRDGGQTWAPISPDLTRPDPAVPPNARSADGEGHGDQGPAARRGL